MRDLVIMPAMAQNQSRFNLGEYAEEVLEGPKDIEPHWDWNKSVSQNLVGFEMTDDTIPF